MFRFENIDMLWWLGLIPLLIVVYLIYIRARARRLTRFGNPLTLAQLMPEASPKRVRRKFTLVLIAIALIVLALARPQFGSKLKEVTSRGVEILLAVDKLGAERVFVSHYRIDGEHSNAYELWKSMGHPQHPTPEQYTLLEQKGRLESFEPARWTDAENGVLTMDFPLPRQGVSLIEIRW